LLGERKGLQTTHSDLIRRIKMLEYALRQERIKFHRLKFGCDPPTIDLTQSPDDLGLTPNEIAAGNLIFILFKIFFILSFVNLHNTIL
jgi:hypothetical protein